MTRRWLVLLLLLVGAAPAAAAPSLPLSRAGRWTVDARGRVVVLHGLNMVYKRPPYTPDAAGFGDDDAAFLAAEGFDSVRLGVIYEAVEPQPGVYDDAYLDRIAATVRTLAAHGIVSLLDFHQDLYSERFQGEGFPEWAVLDDGLPAEPQLGFPGNYLANPATNRAFDNFWANTAGLQDRYAAAWAHVAARFGGDPAVLGYDLFNEPWPGTGWQLCGNPAGCPAFDAKLAAFSRRVLAAVRAVDPATLVYYEPQVLFNTGSDTTIGSLGDPQLGFSFHDYCLQHDTTGSTAGCDGFDDLVFAHAAEQARFAAPLLTEFGATRDPAVLGPMTARADRTMMGWEEWHYCACSDPTTSGPGAEQAVVIDPAVPPTGANVDAAKLAFLTRPYPRVVAGTPEAWAFDPASRAFEARWSARRADGRGAFGAGAVSEIALPARVYVKGAAVDVRGGRVAAPAAARLAALGARSAAPAAPSAPLAGGVLVIAACRGAREVAVSVRPGSGVRSSCSAPAGPRLRVRVSAPPARRGRPVTLRVRVRARLAGRLRPVAGAVVSSGRRRARTDPGGRAVLKVRFARAGRHLVRARARGFEPGRAVLRVRRL